MWGVLPFKSEISWEGHLFGAIAGVLVAYNYRKEGPQKQVYHWENETDDDNDEDAYWKQNPEENQNTNPQQEQKQDIKINYIYKNNPFKGSNE